MSDSSFSKGIGLAIAASVFWGSMGVCAQYLLQQCSFTPLDLVSMRLVLAGLILLIMERLVFGRNIISPLKDIRTTVGILVAGLLILVSQLTFMLAVAASNAGTAAIVLTLVPLICAFWLSITEKRPLTMREGICFVLAASGVFLIVHPLTEGEMEYLKIRLIYPEKFWKTANSYYCTNKAWISVKNIEKLQTAIRQTEEKKMFLKELFGFEL